MTTILPGRLNPATLLLIATTSPSMGLGAQIGKSAMNMQHVDLFITLAGVLFGGFAVLMIIELARHYIGRARERKDGRGPPSH